jgi:hypothetical protein
MERDIALRDKEQDKLAQTNCANSDASSEGTSVLAVVPIQYRKKGLRSTPIAAIQAH